MKRMLVLLLSLAIFCTLVPSAMAGSWTCPDCGKKNSGDYCGECGRYVHANVEREINLVRSEDWFCLNCGNISTDKFCSSCGYKRSKGMEGSLVRYGAYEQDDNIRNGDEDILWIVVREESDSLTLLSLYLLDVQSFDASQSTNRWSDSSLRVWLHNSFLPKAFSETELRYFLQNESDLVSLMPRGMANSALIQREARIAEATDSARKRAEGWIDTNCWFIIDGGVCGYVDGEQGNLGSFCSGGEKQTMYVRPMIVIRNIPVMEEQYQQGLVLMENEEYEEALNIFQGIRIHKDSAEKISLLENLITEKQYQDGIALLESEEYDEALKLFESIRTYKDSTQKIEDCESAILEEKYNAAVALMEEAKYVEALAVFTAMDGYKNSAEQIIKCEGAIAAAEQARIEAEMAAAFAREEAQREAAYKDAAALAECGAYKEAYKSFISLNGYKDSNRQAFSLFINLLDTLTVGESVLFGAYEQDNDSANGKEPIEWQVLDKKDGKILLLSKYALECVQYNTTEENVTWENSTLRKWLNGDFFNDSFTEDERRLIILSDVEAEANSRGDIDPGNNTQDYIFCMSKQEIEHYLPEQEDRRCMPTENAKENGTKAYSGGWCYWWTRTPGMRADHAVTVAGGGEHYKAGDIYYLGSSVSIKIDAVRPAIWISLSQ